MDYVVRQLFDTNNITLNMSKDNDNYKGISRRDALKRMGLFIAGTATLSIPPALISCNKEKKKRIILYFTATGNSLYICLLYTSPSPRDPKTYRMPSSA